MAGSAVSRIHPVRCCALPANLLHPAQTRRKNRQKTSPPTRWAMATAMRSGQRAIHPVQIEKGPHQRAPG
jgi:hypothetical protein